MTNEKNNFILGLAVGIAAVSLLGFIVMAVAYFNKGESSQALNQEANQADKQIDAQKNQPAPAKKTDIKLVEGDYLRGNKDAKNTIIVFSDFQCPFCSKFHNTMNQVLAAYPNDVRWAFKHFPLDGLHSYARKAAEASECAGEQGKFWEYADKLFKNQKSINNDYLPIAAEELSLDMEKFNDCLSNGKYASKVNSDYSQGQQAGITGTPGSLINGELVKGAVSFDSIKSKIEN